MGDVLAWFESSGLAVEDVHLALVDDFDPFLETGVVFFAGLAVAWEVVEQWKDRHVLEAPAEKTFALGELALAVAKLVAVKAALESQAATVRVCFPIGRLQKMEGVPD